MEKNFSKIISNTMFECNSYGCHCMKDIENMVPGEAPRTTLKLYSDIEENLHFYGDEAAIRQVVSVFMDNAMKYTGKNEAGEEKILVSLNRKNRKARLTVFNTCEKIDKEEMARLFERFYRVDKSRSRETGGSGIGLSIVKAIADKHKGMSVKADSKAEGTIEFIADFEIKK